jgi:hypothetical protein
MGQPDALQLPFLDELRRKFGGEGRILLLPLLLSGCDAYSSVIITFVGLQANPIFGYSFYSFPSFILARSLSACIRFMLPLARFA